MAIHFSKEEFSERKSKVIKELKKAENWMDISKEKQIYFKKIK